VGTIEIRKNGANLLRAWQKVLAELNNPPSLVFAGKFGWKTEEFKSVLASDTNLAKHVIVVNNPTDQDLAYLYQNCRFNVYPSLYEGWGLPVGEAAWFGKLSLTSNATSLPEVCGDLVDYVDPHDVNGIARKLNELINSPRYVHDREKVIREAPLRTWQSVADDFYRRMFETDDSVCSNTHDVSRRYAN
jgi:glycosyltransferase involved in cell wall biosynthesis